MSHATSMIRRVALPLALLLSTAALNTAPAPTPAPEFIVVVHAANTMSSIDRDELSKMFLKKVVKWPDGTPVDPIDLASSVRSRIAFTSSVHRKSVPAVRAFWQQQIFSGRSVPPPEKRSDDDVVAYVREHRGAVGYVSASTSLEAGVKILDIKGVAQ